MLPCVFVRPFANCVYDDCTAQNVQSDLGSTLSGKEVFFPNDYYILSKSENASHIFQLKNSSYFMYVHLLFRHNAWLTACSTLAKYLKHRW